MTPMLPNLIESNQSMSTDRIVRQHQPTLFVALAVILLAMGLRTTHYAANPSMWFDELAIARNVADRSFVELIFVPLDDSIERISLPRRCSL